MSERKNERRRPSVEVNLLQAQDRESLAGRLLSRVRRAMRTLRDVAGTLARQK